MPTPADCNLLLGVLALQLDFVTREQLVAVVTSWLREKQTPLGQLLERQKILTAARRQLLEALVDEHLRQHGGDVEQSLATLSSLGPVRNELQRLGDAELSMSLSRIAGGAAAAGGDVPRSDLPAASSVSNPGPRSETASEDSDPPRLRFRILRPHAEGGLGRVLVAHDEELHREVALKEIKPQFAMDVESRNRFTLEAEVTGGLEHPGIVPVYGLGQYSDGRPYYAMRFIRGDSLKEAIEQFHAMLRAQIASLETTPTNVNEPTLIGTKPTTAAASSTEPAPHLVSRETFAAVEFRKLLGRFIDVCQAIEYAHSRGVLHRDLKPGNIMLGKYGETLVVDWGLAKVAGKDDRFANVDEATLVPSSGSSIENTADGSVIGTPAYMSPEQAAGRLEQLGPATDVYSLGATLYHVLTGRSPFSKLPLPELLARVQRGDFPRPHELNSSIPKPLEAVCLKAMALQPEHRYESATAIAEDIEHWLADEPVNAHHEGTLAQASRWVRKHRAWAMSGAAALVLVAVVSSVAAVWMNSAAEAEKKQRLLAEQETKRADAKADEARRHLYTARMNLAQRNWENTQVGLVLDLLEKTRPQPGESDFRGFEWHYWDRLCHSCLFDLKLKLHNGYVNSVAFSADGKRLASVIDEYVLVIGDFLPGELKVWDVTSGQETLTLKGHPGYITSATFSPDGKRLVSAGYQTVKVWDATSGKETLTLKGHTGWVHCVAFSADGKRLASASNDQTVKVWDAMTGQETLTLKGPTGSPSSMAFSPDGLRLASVSNDLIVQNFIVQIWDAAIGQETVTLKGHTGWVRSVAFSADGKWLASASNDQTVKVWDATSGQETLTLKGHTGIVKDVAFSADGKRLVSASDDQTVKVWDATSGQETLTLKGHTGLVDSVAFSKDGKRLASASVTDRTLKVWDATIGQETLTLKGHTGGVTNVAFSADGKRLASVSDDLTVKVWDVASGQETLTLKGHTGGVTNVAFSADGKRLASASNDRTVKVWDTTSGQETLTLKGHTSGVTSVAFSADGKRLASAQYGTLKVWDATSGEETLTLKGDTSYVMSVEFSADGKWLASASEDSDDDGTFGLFDAMNGSVLLSLKGHTGCVYRVAFSADGKRLASASRDGTVKVWNTTSGQATLTLKGHTGIVTGVAFSPDGERLASASRQDGTVKLWDATSGQETLTLKGHTNGVESVAFSPDGKRLASASYDGTVKVWDGRPWTPELRAEREALSLIHFLRDQGQPQSEWLDAIAADQTISEPVRQRALQFAREWKAESTAVRNEVQTQPTEKPSNEPPK